MQLTRNRVRQIVDAGMRELEPEFEDRKMNSFALTVFDFKYLKREALNWMTRRCRVCLGESSETGATPCSKCNDSGFFFDEKVRLKGIDRYLRVMHQESRTLGLYPGKGSTMTGDQHPVSEESLQRFAAMSPAELDQAIAELDKSIAELEANGGH